MRQPSLFWPSCRPAVTKCTHKPLRTWQPESNMAAAEGQSVCPFPLPPVQYYKLYSDENVEKGLIPDPPPPLKGSYSMFGASFEVNCNVLVEFIVWFFCGIIVNYYSAFLACQLLCFVWQVKYKYCLYLEKCRSTDWQWSKTLVTLLSSIIVLLSSGLLKYVHGDQCFSSLILPQTDESIIQSLETQGIARLYPKQGRVGKRNKKST